MGLSRPFHVNGSASRSPWMGPRLQVPDPLPFRVNGQVTISFQSQEVKKVMGGLSIPKKPHWWSQWIETCPFAGGLEDGPSGRAGAESGSGSVFRRRSLRASLNLPEPSTALSEPESLGCSPACGVLGRGWGLPLRRAEHLPSLTVTLGTRMLRPPALPCPARAPGQGQCSASEAGLAQGAWAAAAAAAAHPEGSAGCWSCQNSEEEAPSRV